MSERMEEVEKETATGIQTAGNEGCAEIAGAEHILAVDPVKMPGMAADRSA